MKIFRRSKTENSYRGPRGFRKKDGTLVDFLHGCQTIITNFQSNGEWCCLFVKHQRDLNEEEK